MAHYQHHYTSSSSSSPYQNPQNVYPSAASSFDNEVLALFRHLKTQPNTKRLDILKTLRRVIKRSAGYPLPIVGHSRLHYFEILNFILATESRSTVICECLMLIVDVIPTMEGYDIDTCMAIILPRVIPLLGNENIDVRRATLKLIHVYMRYTNNLQRVLSFYVKYGFENNDHVSQRGAIISLPLLITEEFGNENLSILVDSLSRLLISANTGLFYPVFLAMQRLHSICGNDVFKLYLKRINPEAAALYRSVLSRNSTGNSISSPTGRGESFNESIEQMPQIPVLDNSVGMNVTKVVPNYQNENPIEIEKIITGGDGNVISTALKEFHSAQHHDNRESDNSEEITYIPSQIPYPPYRPLEYGLFPYTVIVRANSTKLAEKLDAIDSVLAIIREAPLTHLKQLIPHLKAFLSEFVGILLEHNNFKVTLSALDMMEYLVERLKSNMVPHMRQLVILLYKRLGDGRAVVRENVIRVFHQMMFILPPQQMLDYLFEMKHSRNPKVREEMVNRVTAAVSTFPRGEFNLSKLCFHVAPMLTDNRRYVRLATLECLAVLAQVLGPYKLSPLISAVEAIEATCECEGLVNALHARLARRALPRCNPDGTVRYVLNPAQYTGWFSGQGEADADMEWVMLASSSNSGTPPKFPSLINQPPKPHKFPNGGIPGGTGIPFPTDRRKTSIAYVPPAAIPQLDSEESNGTPEERIRHETQEKFDNFVGVGHGGGGPVHHVSFDLKNVSTEAIINDQPPERQSYLDNFRGESIVSDDGIDGDRRESIEIWRHYFSRFKKQLADAALCHRPSQDSGSPVFPNGENHIDNANHNFQTQRRKSEQIIAKNGDETEKAIAESQASSSAPSTASADNLPAYMPPSDTNVQHNIPFNEEPQQRVQFEDQVLQERSISMPSIADISRPDSDQMTLPNDKMQSLTVWGDIPPPAQEMTPSKSSVTFISQLDATERAHSVENLQEKVNEDANNDRQSAYQRRSSPPKSVYTQSITIPDDKSGESAISAPVTPTINQTHITEIMVLQQSESLPMINQFNEMTGSYEELPQEYDVEQSAMSLAPDPRPPPPPELIIQEATPIKRNSVDMTEENGEHRKLDVSTQKDETLSSESSTEVEAHELPEIPPDIRKRDNHKSSLRDKQNSKLSQSKTPVAKRKAQPITRRASRSISPQPTRRFSRPPQQLYIKTTPAIPANANIRHILANVAKTEGPFDNPVESIKAALSAIHDDAWTTKVEGMLAIARLATFHPITLMKDQHAISVALVYEVKNLRSTVSRSAIFTIGELFVRLKSQIEPEMDMMAQALLNKSGENVVFIREDIERALMNMIEEMPQTRAAIALILNGSNHRNSYVRKTSAQFLSILVDRMGPTKCLLGPRDIGEHLLPAAARFVQDGSPHTRYFGRKIFGVLMQHVTFEKLLRKYVTPGTYRNICGILESIKRRGIGDRPTDLVSPCKSIVPLEPIDS